MTSSCVISAPQTTPSFETRTVAVRPARALEQPRTRTGALKRFLSALMRALSAPQV